MPAAVTTLTVFWLLCQLALLVLAVLLFWRKNYLQLPYFTSYVMLNLAQGTVLYLAYRSWGFTSLASWKLSWISQGLIIIARALTVAELCRRILAWYRGIWALAWRLLALCVVIILAYSCLVSSWRWQVAVVMADRGLELAIAAALVLLLVFARYYRVALKPSDRLLAIGFGLYSCFMVVNSTILEARLEKYGPLWNVLGLAAYLVTLGIWIWASRVPVPQPVAAPVLTGGDLYRQLSPEINLRLRMLNEHLLAIWKPEVPRS